MTQNVSRLLVRFKNGVSIRGCYRYVGISTVAVTLFVSDGNGDSIHTTHRSYPLTPGIDGFVAVVVAMEEMKQYLLHANINSFKGISSSEVVSSILADKARKEHEAKVA